MLKSAWGVLLIAGLVFAQTATAHFRTNSNNPEARHHSHLTTETTNQVLIILERGNDECLRLPQIYRFDCFRHSYNQATNVLRGNEHYAEAIEAIEGVETSLTRAVRNNSDPAQPPIRRRGQTYRAVQQSAVPQIQRQTEQSMQQAQTVLLRAPTNKQLHYAFIAEAIGSNKVLLRSAMLSLGLRWARLNWQQLSINVKL